MDRAMFAQEAISQGAITKITAKGKATEVFYNPGYFIKASAKSMVIVDRMGIQVEYLGMFNVPIYITIMDLAKHNHNNRNIRLLQEREACQKWSPTKNITNTKHYVKDCQSNRMCFRTGNSGRRDSLLDWQSLT